ncbi:SDR family NAD(P)-dependent oxidoreductase [Streptosporangium sp. NPDC023615]|uniref:SDR family NAD(P)-dependent oxidoreductase n=1 Tax=Streptosporangium sp. NPDC023615 TaxID=3154794 RepID=UPI00343E51E1
MMRFEDGRERGGAATRFEGRVAIVTGGARGIGEAYVRALAAEGAHVVVADLETAAGERVAEQVGGQIFNVDGGHVIRS